MNTKNSTSSGKNAALALAVAVTLSGCSKEDATESNVLAEVDGQAITAATFEHWWQKSPREDSSASREALLEQLIEREALVQRARKAGLEQDSHVIEGFQSLLIARLKELELQPRIAAATVPEADVRAIYEAEKNERFKLPARVHLAVLWFETRGQAPLAARYQPRLEQVRTTLLANPESVPAATGFGSHSVRNTEHRSSRYKGGNLGWIESGSVQLDPFRRTVSEIGATLTEPGQLSEVTVRPEGIFLVRLIERQPERIRSFAEVRASIEQRLLAARRSDVQQQFHQQSQEDLTVERFPNNLSALSDLPTTSPLTQSKASHAPTNLPVQR
jgi:hypothetical protein